MSDPNTITDQDDDIETDRCERFHHAGLGDLILVGYVVPGGRQVDPDTGDVLSAWAPSYSFMRHVARVRARHRHHLDRIYVTPLCEADRPEQPENRRQASFAETDSICQGCITAAVDRGFDLTEVLVPPDRQSPKTKNSGATRRTVDLTPVASAA